MASSVALLLVSLCASAYSATQRTSYIQAQLNSYNAGLSASQRAEKYADMNQSAFDFYRGTDHLYWKDLGTSTSLASYGGASTTDCTQASATDCTRIWLSGDMHVNNMGAFMNSDGSNSVVVYDLNDFDEALIADYQLDVWRAAISIALVMDQNGGFSSSDKISAVGSFLESYLDSIESYAGTSKENTKVFTASNTYGQLDDFLSSTTSTYSGSPPPMLKKYTSSNNGVRSFDFTNSDLATVTTAEKTAVTGQFTAANYGVTLSGGLSWSSSYFTVKDVAQRLHAGIGSLGVPRYYVLIEGPSSSTSDDVILDVKGQTTPSGYLNVDPKAVTATNTSCGGNSGKRVELAQKSLGYKVDDHLGWVTLNASIYSVRQLNNYKATFDTTGLMTLNSVTNMAEQWGAVLATAHSRADQDSGSSTIAYNFDYNVYLKINHYHTEFKALAEAVIFDYETQVNYDYQSFVSLLGSGGLN